MLHENIRFKRKERGFSQEDLAVRLHVVRQTVSKWENGMSVPDAEQLAALADVLHTTVGELLGATLENEESRDRLAEELARINAQLAIRNQRARRVLKAMAVVLLVFAALSFLTMLLFMALNYMPASRTQNEFAKPLEIQKAQFLLAFEPVVKTTELLW